MFDEGDTRSNFVVKHCLIKQSLTVCHRLYVPSTAKSLRDGTPFTVPCEVSHTLSHGRRDRWQGWVIAPPPLQYFANPNKSRV